MSITLPGNQHEYPVHQTSIRIPREFGFISPGDYIGLNQYYLT
jgi:hypothetical protein